MSKSILQEVATLNAELFNEAKLKAGLSEITADIETFKYGTHEMINDLNDKYEMVIAGLLEKTTTLNEQLRAEMLKIQIDVTSLTQFNMTELANNFYSKGSMTKRYLRDNVKTNDRINQLHLNTLAYHTGPIKEVVLDSDNNFSGYSTPILEESERPWVYIIDDSANYRGSLRYRGINLLELSNDETTITIGDGVSNNLKLPGNLEIENNITINDGSLSIHSPANALNSIFVNGNITSTGGKLKVHTGMQTTAGDIITGHGDIRTIDGGGFFTNNIETTTGNINAFAGSMFANLGYVTATGGFTCNTSGGFFTPSGNFETENGKFIGTHGFTTTGGNIEITGTGGGNITTKRGSIKTNDGDISTLDGDIKTNRGNISTLDGNISTDDGDLTISDGRTILGGDVSIGNGGDLSLGTGSDLSISNGDLTMSSGDLNVGSGDLSVGGSLDMGGKFNNSFTGLSEFAGDLYIGGDFEIGGALEVDNLEVKQNALIKGTLDVKGVTTFSANVDAGGNTIKAAVFDGVATSAKYADVAEKYESDINYAPGTVVSIGIDTEITLYNPELPLAGVISTDPGYLLNKRDETEEYSVVALSGRIPVLTDMIIKRGMYILPDIINLGKCIGVTKSNLHLDDHLNMIGIAISDSNDGKVEVKV